MSEAPKARFFAVKTTGGQEKTVATFVSTRTALKNKPLFSLLVFDSMKGYIFIEAGNAQVVGESISGFKHVKSQVPGIIKFEDIEKFLVTKPVISEVGISDIVEVVAGPFKGMKARVNRVEPTRSEVTIVLLDAPYQLPVTVRADYVKIIEKAKEATS